jgi:hypothetical protein
VKIGSMKVWTLALAALLPLAACGGDASAEKDGEKGKAAASADTGKGAEKSATAPGQPSADSLARAFVALMAQDTGGAAQARTDSTKRWNAGTNPLQAIEEGWPVKFPTPLPGSLLPYNRVIAYYGNPASKRMGVLGEYPKEEMLSMLDREVQRWREADPTTPVIPALHLVAVVAQGDAGPSGMYRTQVRDSVALDVYSWIKSRNGIFFVDVQTGWDQIQNLAPRFEYILKNPDVHFAVDPEFMMIHNGRNKPGAKIGSMPASDINWTIQFLAGIVDKYHLPPKILVIHRFTRNMIPDAENIRLDPRVQVVIDMDGWGAPWLKRDSYRDYVVQHPVQFTGFKLFYHNDTKKGDPLMSPMDLLQMRPVPRYIQYQ